MQCLFAISHSTTGIMECSFILLMLISEFGLLINAVCLES
jgi:hypothetical protein